MLTYSSVSRPGSRPVNEDFVAGLKNADKYLFVLCDGLGGHGSGNVASETAAKAFADIFKKNDGDIVSFYNLAYAEAQKRIIDLQDSDESMSMMKTTLVSLLIDGEICSWSHIGDSRLYYFSGGKLVCRTADHSVPQMLYKSGEISEGEIRFHPDRNKLLRALGDPEKGPQFTISDITELDSDSAFLLCSDGFWEYITEDMMEELLSQSRDAEGWLIKMTDIVEQNNAGEKSDNYSAVAVMTGEDC